MPNLRKASFLIEPMRNMFRKIEATARKGIEGVDQIFEDGGFTVGTMTLKIVVSKIIVERARLKSVVRSPSICQNTTNAMDTIDTDIKNPRVGHTLVVPLTTCRLMINAFATM